MPSQESLRVLVYKNFCTKPPTSWVFCVIADESKTVRDFGKGEHQRGGDVSVDHRPGLAIEARAATAPQHFAGIAPTRATPDQADRVRKTWRSEAQQEQEEFVLLQVTIGKKTLSVSFSSGALEYKKKFRWTKIFKFSNSTIISLSLPSNSCPSFF